MDVISNLSLIILQNWEDQDVVDALEWLREKLAENIQLLSSFDKYKREVWDSTVSLHYGWAALFCNSVWGAEPGALSLDSGFSLHLLGSE